MLKSPNTSAQTSQNNCLLFIPGFKGSILIDKSGNQIWPNFIRSQFNQNTSLRYEDNHNGAPNYQSQDIIHSVPLIPKLLAYDVYGKFVIELQKQLPATTAFSIFHYDWRQDLQQVATQLKAQIDSHTKQGIGSIDFICHSMGGLIVANLLKAMKVNIVRKVFFVGTPFQGVPRVILDLIQGTRLGLNKSLLSAQAMASFPSLYYLLPRLPEFTNGHDFFNLETWQQYKIGYYARNDENIEFLARQLKIANDFYHQLENLSSTKVTNTKLFFIHSLKHSTPTKLSLMPSIDLKPSKGDGTVPENSLAVPSYLRNFDHQLLTIDKLHGKSFSCETVLKFILDNLSS